MRETCFYCKHANFQSEANTPMRGFAKCEKSQTPEQRASYYFGGYKCDKGDLSSGKGFQPADEIVIQKRREKFEEWRNKRK